MGNWKGKRKMLVKMIVSSVMILGVLIIRTLFQKKVNPICIYALWLPVAIRLLMPGMPVDSPLSIMHTKVWEKAVTALTEENDRQKTEYKEKKYREYLEKTLAESFEVSEKAAEPKTVSYELKWQLAGTFFERIGQIAVMTWFAGMAVFSVVFIWQNFSFYRYIRATRQKLMPGRRPVFAVGNRLTSPCLFGLFPAVYIPEEMALAEDAGEEFMSFILAHELTHYRHLDHIWALVRALCLIINWYNPLVWIGAKLSVRDGELACDAGCIRRIGEENRFAYGDALLRAVKQVRERKDFFCQGILMVSEKKYMKKRMENIGENRKGSRAAMLVMLVMFLVCIGFTCTGRIEKEEFLFGYILSKSACVPVRMRYNSSLSIR